MTSTFSQSNYTDLLIQHQPKRIKTEEEYQNCLTIIEGMMSRELTEAETELFELLVLLIEAYENRHHPMGKSTSQATLESLMHEFDLEPNILAEIMGSAERVKAAIQGQQKINPSQATGLAQFFNHLSPALALTAQDFESS